MDPENEPTPDAPVEAEATPPAPPAPSDQADGTADASPETQAAAAAAEPADVTPILPAPEIRAVLEALIFCSPQPVTAREITQVMEGVPKSAWLEALAEIQQDYARDGRGLQVVEVAAGYQITTRPE